jgi:hypothetical protein
MRLKHKHLSKVSKTKTIKRTRLKHKHLSKVSKTKTIQRTRLNKTAYIRLKNYIAHTNKTKTLFEPSHLKWSFDNI